MVLVIDGSDSISAKDFMLQKEGIKRAVQNPSILPRNGSISLSIIQYGGTTTKVHLSYTPINNDSDIANVITHINNISQIGYATNPGDGINTGMSVLSAKGNTAKRQAICLSTDGLPNSGADVATALNNARNSPISLDRFTVIAIEDPPHFYRSHFESFYNPLVFGGGVVTVVKDSVEFANSIGGCLTNAVELVGLEVNQVIQDWKNSVELITSKTTYVRAHIQSTDQNSTRVFARLYGTRNGSDLPGSPLTPINSNGSIDVSSNVAAQRGKFDKSLNFRLPSSWLNGTIDLRIEGIGTKLECKEVASTPNDCSVQVTFNPTDRLEVEFVPVNWTQDGTSYEVLPGHLFELAERLRAIYPIASDTTGLDWRIHDTNVTLSFTGTNQPELDSVLSDLWWIRFWDRCWSILGCDRLYYGVLRGPDVGGLGEAPGTLSAGTMPELPFIRGRHRHGHELAHNLGQPHTVHSSLGLDTNGDKQGWCNESADATAPDFPYSAVINGQTMATIGPMELGQDNLIYGLDTQLLASSVASEQQEAVIDPKEHFELMSYCGTAFRWISKQTYTNIRAAINNRFIVAHTSTNPSTIGIQEYMVIRGTVDFSNDTIAFDPISSISSDVQPPQPIQGDYKLQLISGSGQLVNEVVFQPTVYHVDAPAKEPNSGTFLIPVLASPEIKQVTILHNGKVLSSKFATPNLPTVEIIHPNGGESLTGDKTSVEWIGNDLDGDSLTYIVQYSPDNGITWQTLAVDLPNQSYDIKLSSIQGTNNGRIRVIASDGFNTAVDTSDGTFSVANNPPQVSIISPINKNLFIGNQTIFFQGEALDREDFHLSGTNLEWRSDKDGTLGNGENLALEATQLSEGKHTITLIARDQVGQTNTASVTISVFRLSPQTLVYLPISLKNSNPAAGPTLVPTSTPANTPTPGPTNTPTNIPTPTHTNTPTNTPTPSPTTPPPTGTTLRIEAGGTTTYTDGAGNFWAADTGFIGGNIIDRGNIEIANTSDDRIYQTERYGMSGYAFPVANGDYTVRLHFAETHIGITGAGQRVFSVNVEGTAINNIDIFAETGGRNIALVKSVAVAVTDGQLSLSFAASVQNTEINGIEVIPRSSGVRRIEAGGSADYTDTFGNLWAADAGFIGGSTIDRSTIDIVNSNDDRIYQTERYSMTGYRLPIANGSYQVRLHFAETYEGITGPGQRVFGVTVEGIAINNLDIFAETGGRNIALIKTTNVTVVDGQLDISFTRSVQNPAINGIEVIPQ